MPSATVSAIVIDTKPMLAKLDRVTREQLPQAQRRAVSDLAWDTIRIEKLEMQDVFVRPKPFVLGGLRMLRRATVRDPTAVIGFTDVSGRFGGRVEDIVRTHIEGTDRGTKDAEDQLRAARIIGPREFLVRARSARTDVYGNVPRSTWAAAVRSLLSRGRSSNRTRYFVQDINAGRGIFRVTGKRGKPRLVWIVASRPPQYRRRFDFYGEAQRHAARFGGYFARQAVERTLAAS